MKRRESGPDVGREKARLNPAAGGLAGRTTTPAARGDGVRPGAGFVMWAIG
ncbi:hypothetical protein [Deinococcus sp. AJ005]|uniref:hypothetical protein n=1 Tax=Deinococcus sp. AJ005 TaxID=2652443 RepID=UPI0018657F6E|nr:hypothetical protein [Deinococcus sp. AJ005]